MLKALVCGVFDLLHIGHLDFLSKAAQVAGVDVGGELHVGMGIDSDLFLLKGRWPIMTWHERAIALEATRYVTEVHAFEIWVPDDDMLPFHRHVRNCDPGRQNGHAALIANVAPDVFIVNEEKPVSEIGALPYLEEAGIPIERIASEVLHTSDILKRIRGRLPCVTF